DDWRLRRRRGGGAILGNAPRERSGVVRGTEGALRPGAGGSSLKVVRHEAAVRRGNSGDDCLTVRDAATGGIEDGESGAKRGHRRRLERSDSAPRLQRGLNGEEANSRVAATGGENSHQIDAAGRTGRVRLRPADRKGVAVGIESRFPCGDKAVGQSA